MLIDLILTAVGYLLVPFIFWMKANATNQKYTMDTIKKIVIINGICVWVIFRIITLEMTDEVTTGAAVFLWSGVAFWFLKRNCLIENNDDIPEETEDPAPSATEENTEDENNENQEADVGGQIAVSKKKAKPILLIAGIAIAVIILVITLILPAYKYNYVLEHQNNDNATTFEYLKDLKKRDYKDSANIYENLYAWEVTVVAINSSETDKTTYQKSISKNSPIRFHIKLTGGEPNEQMRITVKSTLPNGRQSEYTFSDKWDDGAFGWYGWSEGIYGSSEYGSTGILRCEFYDEEGNLIGSGSVQITDSGSASVDENNRGENVSRSTCIDYTCDNIVMVSGTYCSEHKCANSDCSYSKEYNSQYCAVCQCGKLGCKSLKLASGYYCNDHTCNVAECTSGKESNSNYCITHKCSYCDNPQIDNGLYCIEHTCAKKGCSALNMGSEYCLSHTCVAGTCKNETVDGGNFCKQHTCIVAGCMNQKLLDDYCYYHTN